MTMDIELLKEQVLALIESGDRLQLKSYLDELNISDIELLVDGIPEYAPLIIDSLSIHRAVNAFRILDNPTQERVIKKLPNHKIYDIINELPPDDRTSFFGELKDSELQHRLISLLSPEDRKEVYTLLSYPEDSVGRLMTPDFLAIPEHFYSAQ